MKALQISNFGKAAEVIEIIDIEEPTPPAAGSVTVELEYAAINPATLLMMSGLYGIRPTLPAPMGGEGVGRVIAVGPDVDNVKVGDLVTYPEGQPTWREQLNLSAQGLNPLPKSADLQQLSMLRINPSTAAFLLTEYVSLKAGDWVVQDGGNSGVGRSVIAMAKDMGLRTVSLVRRPELVEELKAVGGDVVLVDGPGIGKAVAEATGKAKIMLGLDGVGGDTAHSVASCLAWGASLIVYGGTSGKPLVASPLNVIFKNISIRGFWLGYPHFQNNHARQAEHLKTSIRLIEDGKLSVPIAGVYTLSQAKEAIAHAQRGGKVLLKAR